jgi:hypothetical protein
MSESNEAFGPIDFVLLEFPEQEPTGRSAAELTALVDGGVIRLYDIVAARKSSDGNVTTVDVSELGSQSGFAALAGARSGILGADDIAEAGAALKPDTVGVLIVYENAWAGPFVEAAQDAGGQMIATSRVAVGDVVDALDGLD